MTGIRNSRQLAMPTFKTISDCLVHLDCDYDRLIFLTFDIDWAHDEVLTDSINLVEKADVAATWFVTHDTPLLVRLRANPKFELGIHPNFNYLLQGDTRNGGNAEEVVDRLLNIVPEAKSVRSHSILQNSKLMDIFLDRGLTHDCNHFIPEQSGIELKPWRLWNGITKVPYFWEDDAAFIYRDNASISLLTERKGLKVFDFHPIHVFLNTERADRYDSTRPWHGDPGKLVEHRSDDPGGTRMLLEQLLEVAKQ